MYTTLDTNWQEGDTAYFWNDAEKTMTRVTILSVGQCCQNGFETYNCLTYGEESDDDQCVIKHQQLFALREETKDKILIDAYQNELVMNANLFSKSKLSKAPESLQLKYW